MYVPMYYVLRYRPHRSSTCSLGFSMTMTTQKGRCRMLLTRFPFPFGRLPSSRLRALSKEDLADVEFSRAMTPSAQFAPFACRASDPIGEWHPVSRACRRDANLWRIEIMDDAWQRE